jgi:polysaccharide chain length determinant protein (PEP-CTERM system associated)
MTGSKGAAPKALDVELSPSHYFQLLLHRKWIVICVFVAVSAVTIVVAQLLPNIYSSETVILVDPQKVPEAYVKATVTGDVRNRLGTLTQQILSTTRLQKIIESFNLYAEERKKLAREDVIARMRADINVSMVTGGGQQGDLQAFKITYSGRDPRLVAAVTSQIASLFIEENLKAREQQATGTTEFLQHTLDETKKTLEDQETKLRDFRMKHVGEMPEHQVSTLTVLGQLQASLQQENEALSRAEQQRTYLQTTMTQAQPVVDVDGVDDSAAPFPTPAATAKSQTPSKGPASPAVSPNTSLADDRVKLAALLARYTDSHPEVRRLKEQIADKEAKEARNAPPGPAPVSTEAAKAAEPPVPVPPAKKRPVLAVNLANPVLVSQLKNIEAEIARHKEEQQRLNRLVSSYQSKLEAIPVREQQIAELVRDYEITKAHYSGLLDKQFSAETATQLEIRQKAEKFSILDPAQPAQRPSKPNRLLIDFAGSVGGLLLGVILAIGSEFFGVSITCAEHVPLENGNQVLEIIPIILTENDLRRRRKQMIMATVSGGVTMAAVCGVLIYHLRG